MPRKPRIPNETKEARFRRLAEQRANDLLRKIRILGNCSNRNVYSYDEQQVEKIFQAIEAEVAKTRALFSGRMPPPTVKL